MSAVVPKNYSPSLLSERRESLRPAKKIVQEVSDDESSSSNNTKSAPGGTSTSTLIIELFVLTAVVIAIIFIVYVMFSPIITNLFGTVIDTVNGISSVAAESLGTITQTLGSVINTATAVVNQVSGVGVSTISTLTTVLTTTLKTTTNVIVGDGSDDNKGLLGSFENVLKGIAEEIVGREAKTTNGVTTPAKIGLLTTINNTIENISVAIIGNDEKVGILTTIAETAKNSIESFIEFIQEIGTIFFSVLNTIRTSMETVISGITDGIRYLVEPFLNTSYGIPAIARTLASVVSEFNDAVSDIGSKIKQGIDAVANAIESIAGIFTGD